jgi:hypothetical protein
MGLRNRWMSQAEDEEQGSFCDTASTVHYQNVSKSEAEELEEDAMRRGMDLVAGEAPSNDHQPSSQRYNTFDTDVDGKDFDSPSKHEPGR